MHLLCVVGALLFLQAPAVPASRYDEIRARAAVYLDSARSEVARQGHTKRWERLSNTALAYDDTLKQLTRAIEEMQRARAYSGSQSTIPWWVLAVLGGLLVSGAIGALMLASRDRAGTGFLLGLFLGPIGWLMATMMRQEKPPAVNSELPAPAVATEIKCPDCAELIKAEARRCRFCGYVLRPE